MPIDALHFGVPQTPVDSERGLVIGLNVERHPRLSLGPSHGPGALHQLGGNATAPRSGIGRDPPNVPGLIAKRNDRAAYDLTPFDRHQEAKGRYPERLEEPHQHPEAGASNRQKLGRGDFIQPGGPLEGTVGLGDHLR
jgi:hypothetical protein